MADVNVLQENETNKNNEIEETKEFIEILKTLDEREKYRVIGYMDCMQTLKV